MKKAPEKSITIPLNHALLSDPLNHIYMPNTPAINKKMPKTINNLPVSFFESCFILSRQFNKIFDFCQVGFQKFWCRGEELNLHTLSGTTTSR